MSHPNARLAAIAFAESRHASTTLGLEKPDMIEGVRRFLEACYEEAGAAPEKLDGEQLAEILLTHLPRRCARRDPFVPMFPELLKAFFADLEERALVPHAFEIRKTLEDVGQRFEAAVRNTPDQERRGDSGPVPTLTRPSAKVGRNDPCPCGSGKKYKQCCLRLLG